MKRLAFTLFAVALTAAPGQAQKLQVGEYIDAGFDSPHPYRAPAMKEASLLFSQEIYDEGASYIAPYFSRMGLAEGDYVIVRSPDFSRSWKYEGYGKAELGRQGNEGFWGVHIRGDRAIIELWGQSGSGAYGYSISRYARGFDHLDDPNEDDESICTADDKENAICYDGTPQYEEGRAVVRLLIQGSFLCTGWLLGDEGHMMTNEHCITSNADAMNTDYEFMAEGATCEENCPQLGCDGVIEETSGTLIQDSVALDYALVQLPSNHSGTYGFMQLRDTGAVLGERIWSAQHPGGRGKEFAVVSTYPDNPSGFAEADSVTEAPCDPTSIEPEVGYWMDTEGGSSGSPVLGWTDNLVIALHHCRGNSFCTTGDSNVDDPNRGVPVGAIITDLGANLPNNAIGFSTMIFQDGFESGDTSSWSTTIP